MTRRPSCAACLRPLPTCICAWVAPQAHAVEVLILQHPLEVANAKNSGRLLHLNLPNSQLVVGEAFDPAALRALLAGKNNVLLYPDGVADAALGVAPPPPLEPGWLDPLSRLRLIVLDATWRKSRKMLYLNPLLQQLPRLPLRDTPPSHYLIRKAHAPDQLSTLEAACYALLKLENPADPGAGRVAGLIDAFDGFVAQQLRYISAPRDAVANSA